MAKPEREENPYQFLKRTTQHGTSIYDADHDAEYVALMVFKRGNRSTSCKEKLQNEIVSFARRYREIIPPRKPDARSMLLHKNVKSRYDADLKDYEDRIDNLLTAHAKFIRDKIFYMRCVNIDLIKDTLQTIGKREKNLNGKKINAASILHKRS